MVVIVSDTRGGDTHTHIIHIHTFTRYTCETYFARVKNKSALLKGECTHYHWDSLEAAWCVGHYGANLQPPLRLPAIPFLELKRLYDVHKSYNK